MLGILQILFENLEFNALIFQAATNINSISDYRNLLIENTQASFIETFGKVNFRKIFASNLNYLKHEISLMFLKFDKMAKLFLEQFTCKICQMTLNGFCFMNHPKLCFKLYKARRKVMKTKQAIKRFFVKTNKLKKALDVVIKKEVDGQNKVRESAMIMNKKKSADPDFWAQIENCHELLNKPTLTTIEVDDKGTLQVNNKQDNGSPIKSPRGSVLKKSETVEVLAPSAFMSEFKQEWKIIRPKTPQDDLLLCSDINENRFSLLNRKSSDITNPRESF